MAARLLGAGGWWTVGILLLAGLVGCEHGGPLEEDGLQPTLASIQINIFDRSCAVSGCHIGPRSPRNLDLSAGSARANLVGVASGGVPSLLRVDPGNAEDSYLVLKLEGDPRIAGQMMPLNLPALSATEIGAIRQWIDDGAN